MRYNHNNNHYNHWFYGIALLLCLNLFSSCTFVRTIVYNKPAIDDVDLFYTSKLDKSGQPFSFVETPYKALPPTEMWIKDSYMQDIYSFEEFLVRSNTTSFLVVRNDTLLYENYFNGYTVNEPSIVFSVTKAITTALIGIAIEEGYIDNVHQKVVEFIPAFAKDERRNITLEHLLQMTSGLNFEDKRTLFKLSSVYYTKNLEHYITKVKLKHKPGTKFAYKSIDTQILSLCLEKAIGRSVVDYLREKLWNPLQMEYDAYITLDSKQGSARMYGGLAACARDLAKFGRLYLNNGSWNGNQIIPENWIAKSSMPTSDGGGWWGYATGWWLHDEYTDRNLLEKQDFAAIGYNGQYVYVNPEANIVIVRQGKGKKNIEWLNISRRLADLLNTCATGSSCTSPDIYKNQFTGVYRSKKNTKLIIKKKAKKEHWSARLKWGGRFLGFTNFNLESESPLSLFNEGHQKRLIFEIENGQIIGLYFDNYRKTTYFEKEDGMGGG